MERLGIVCSKRHTYLVVGLVLAFATLVGLQLHGYSISMWSGYLRDSGGKEIIFGKPRDIRSDDWLLDIPTLLAQEIHEPPLPVINKNIGEGQNMLLPIKAPVRGLTEIFRPTTWGFYLGADTGLAWMWWSMLLGLWYAYFLFFSVVTEDRFWLSLGGGALVAFSPFFQFWSLHKSSIAIHAALIFVFTAQTFLVRRKLPILVSGVLLGWSLGAFAIEHVYPPFQVSMGYVAGLCALGFLADRRKLLPKSDWGIRVFALALALLVFAIGAGDFYLGAKQTVSLISQTDYPGQRFVPGGGLSLSWLISDLFFFHSFVRQWQPLGNPCEGTSFFLFAPLIVGMAVFEYARTRRRPGWMFTLTVGYLVVLVVYALWGVPPWFARITLLGRLTPNRAAMALGILDLVLVLSFLSRSSDQVSRRDAGIAAAAWGLFIFAIGLSFRKSIVELTWLRLVGITLVQSLLAWLIVTRARRGIFVAVLVVISFFYTHRFNPLVRGGTTLITESPLSLKIKALDAEAKGESRWVNFGDPSQAHGMVLANLFKMLGVKSIGGYHGYPHFSIWKKFDSAGQNRRAYNQSAFVYFEPTDLSKPAYRSSPGNVIVAISPRAEVFRELGVNYFLVSGKAFPHFEKEPRLKRIFSHLDNHIYVRSE